MAGLGHRTWTRERLTSADLQGYIQDQVVTVWASRSARTAGLPAPDDGMVSYLLDEDVLEQCTAGAWRIPGALGVVHYASQTTAGSSASTTFARITGTINASCTLYPGRLYRGKLRAHLSGNTAGDIGQVLLLMTVGASATPAATDPQVAAVNFHIASTTSGAGSAPVCEDLFTVPAIEVISPNVWVKRLSGTGTVTVGPQVHGKWTVEVEDVGSVALRAERQISNLGAVVSAV